MDYEIDIEKLIKSCELNRVDTAHNPLGEIVDKFTANSLAAEAVMQLAEIMTHAVAEMFGLIGTLPKYVCDPVVNARPKKIQLDDEARSALDNISISIEVAAKYVERIAAVAQAEPSGTLALLVRVAQKSLALMTQTITKTEHVIEILLEYSNESATDTQPDKAQLLDEIARCLSKNKGTIEQLTTIADQLPQIALAVSSQLLTSMAQELQIEMNGFKSKKAG